MLRILLPAFTSVSRAGPDLPALPNRRRGETLSVQAVTRLAPTCSSAPTKWAGAYETLYPHVQAKRGRAQLHPSLPRPQVIFYLWCSNQRIFHRQQATRTRASFLLKDKLLTASMSTVLTPAAALFPPQKASVDLHVPLSPKRKLKFGVRIWRWGWVFKAL